MKHILLITCLFIGAICFNAQAEEINGEAIFNQNCRACHHLDQRLVGPPLKDIHKRRDEAWLLKFIKNSQALVQAGDADAVALFNEYNQIIMPEQKFSDDEIKAVLAYLVQASAPKNGKAGEIPRPEEKITKQYQPLRFNSFTFWLPYTLAIFLIIALFYYLVDVASLASEMKRNEHKADE